MKKYLIICALVALSIFQSSASNYQRRFDSIPSTDTTCLKEIRAAKIDIANGKLIYFRYAGSMLFISLRCADEFKTLLNKYNIGYRDNVQSDCSIPGQTQNCYSDYMNLEIDKIFGPNFIDSLKNVADILFVRHHINGHYLCRDCDIPPMYPGEASVISEEKDYLFQKDFESIRYPTEYVRRPTGRDYWSIIAYVDVNLLVDKRGNATILDCEFSFDKAKNHEFEPYLKKEILRNLKKKNWTPAIIRNKKVTAECYKRIYLK